MTDKRSLDTGLQEDLRRLTRGPRKGRRLAAADGRPDIEQQRGYRTIGDGSVGGGGGGIASPLTEVDPDARTEYSLETIESTDGFIVLEINQYQTFTFNDANGDEVQITLGQATL